MALAKKALVIFELEGCLQYSRYAKSRMVYYGNNLLKDKPDSTINDYNLYYRIGYSEQINKLFRQYHSFYDVAVWSSSHNKVNTELFAKKYFNRYYKKQLFVSNTATNAPIKSQENKSISIERNQGGVFEKFPHYSPQNTIVVSSHKNLIQSYAENDIIVKYYSPENLGYKFNSDFDIHILGKYLEGLQQKLASNEIEDIRPMLATIHLEYAATRFAEHVHEFSNV